MAANFDVMNSTEEQNELQNAAENQPNAAETQQKPNINRRKYKMIVFKNLAETQQNQTDNQLNQTVNQQNQTDNQLNQTVNQQNQTDNQLNQTVNRLNLTKNQQNPTKNKQKQTKNQQKQTKNQQKQTKNQQKQTKNQQKQTKNQQKQTVNQPNQTVNQPNQTVNQPNQTVNQQNSTENQQFHNLRVERFPILLKAFNSLSKQEAIPSRLVESLKQKGVNIENTVTTVATNNEATNKLLQCSIEMDNGLIAFVGETHEIRQEAIKLAGQLLRTFIDKLTNLLNNFQTVYRDYESKIQIFNDLKKKKYRIPGFIRIEESKLSFSVQIERVAHFASVTTGGEHKNKAKEQFVEFLKQLSAATETRNNHNVLPTTSSQEQEQELEQLASLLNTFNSLSREETQISVLVEALKQEGVNVQVSTVAHNDDTSIQHKCSIKVDNLEKFVSRPNKSRQVAINSAVIMLAAFFRNLNSLVKHFKKVYRDKKSKFEILSQLKQACKPNYIQTVESESSFRVQVIRVFATKEEGGGAKDRKQKVAQKFVAFVQQLTHATNRQGSSSSNKKIQKLRSSIQSRDLHDESYYKILLGQFESFQGTIEEKFDNFLHSCPVEFKTKQLDNGQIVIQEIVLENGAKFDDSSKSENSTKSSKKIIGQKLFKYLRCKCQKY